MKVFITGASGFIGKHVIKAVNRAGHKIVASRLVNDKTENTQNNIQWLYADLADLESFKPILKYFNPDVVIHLAAISNDPMGNNFSDVTDEINSKASEEIAKKSKEAGVKKFIFASSCSMYGTTDNNKKKESDSLNPLTAYAKSKIESEKHKTFLSSTTLQRHFHHFPVSF